VRPCILESVSARILAVLIQFDENIIASTIIATTIDPLLMWPVLIASQLGVFMSGLKN